VSASTFGSFTILSMQLGVKRRDQASRSRSFSLLRTLAVCLAEHGGVQILKVPVSSRTMLRWAVSTGGSLDHVEGGVSVFFVSSIDFFDDPSELSN